MKAIIILSGGLDSTVMLAYAINKGLDCVALSFDYQQRNKAELLTARNIAAIYEVPHFVVSIDPQSFANSSLVDDSETPKLRSKTEIYSEEAPATYVPARNTLFIAFAIAQAEIHSAQAIYLGVNAADQRAYPDTTPAYRDAYQQLINTATHQARHGCAPELVFPFVKKTKKEIIALGLEIKAPLHLTLSCYDPDPATSSHCGCCDACYLRKEGYAAAGVMDPTCYTEPGLPLKAVELEELI